MHVAKKGLRVLGIAESFRGRRRSTLAGVVMRKDLIIDGAAFSDLTVGGMDATEAVLKIIAVLDRNDINCVMIAGCIISWYNIIDLEKASEESGIPFIAVTYEESEGISEDITHHFPGDMERLAAYCKLGTRLPVVLSTGFRIFIRPYGISPEEAMQVCDAFTHEGKVPEPLRVARILARAAMRSGLMEE